MNAEQLVAKIKAFPVLAVHFERSDGVKGICPCCVDRILKIQDQEEVENVLDTIAQCTQNAENIKTRIDQVTRELRAKLDRNLQTWREAEHRLYELRNAHYNAPT